MNSMINESTEYLTQNGEEIGFWDSITDERAREYYMFRGGPGLVFAISGVYLFVVLYLGPKLMAKREPFKLNKLILWYNISMALMNFWLFVEGMKVSRFGIDTLGCLSNHKEAGEEALHLGHVFFLSKYIEFLDTIFFVLRKRDRQLTFLHVFHHSTVPLFVWIGVKIAPGGSSGFFPLCNSFVHTFMYSYYALSTFGPKIEPYLWWKKYLTSLQMFQFVMVMVNITVVNMSNHCGYPWSLIYLQNFIAAAFLILFGLFYRDAYYNKKSKKNQNIKLIADQLKHKDENGHKKSNNVDNFEKVTRRTGNTASVPE